MRFHSAALSGGLILSSLSGAATQETSTQSGSDHTEPSVRRHSNIKGSSDRRDSVLGAFKKFLPDVDIPAAFGFSTNQVPDKGVQGNHDTWPSDSSAHENSEKRPSDDGIPDGIPLPLSAESAISKTMAFPRRALSTTKPLIRRSSSQVSSKKSSAARVTSSGRIVKTSSRNTSSTRKTVSVIRGAPLSKSSTRTMISQQSATSTQKASSRRTTSSSQKVSSPSRLTKPIRGSKLPGSVASSSTRKATSSSPSRHTSSVEPLMAKQSACSARKGVTISLMPPVSSVLEDSSDTQKLSSSTNKASGSIKTSAGSTQRISSATKLAAGSVSQELQSSGRPTTEAGFGQGSFFSTSRASTKGNVPSVSSRSTITTISTSRTSSQPTFKSSSQKIASTSSKTSNAVRGPVLGSSSVSTKAPSAVRGSLPKSSTAQDHSSSTTGKFPSAVSLSIGHSTSQSTSSKPTTTTSSRGCRGMLSCPPVVSIQTSSRSTQASSKQTPISSATSHNLPSSSSIAGGNIAIKSDLTNPHRGQLPSKLSTLSVPTTSLIPTSTILPGSSISSSAKPSTIRGQLPVPGSSSSRSTASSQVSQASPTASSSHVSLPWVIGSGNPGDQSSVSKAPSQPNREIVSSSSTITNSSASQVSRPQISSTPSTSVTSDPLRSTANVLPGSKDAAGPETSSTSLQPLFSSFARSGTQVSESITGSTSSSIATRTQSSAVSSDPSLSNEDLSATSTATNTLDSLGNAIGTTPKSRSDSVISFFLPTGVVSMLGTSNSASFAGTLDGSATTVNTAATADAANHSRITSSGSILASFGSFSSSSDAGSISTTSGLSSQTTSTGLPAIESTRSTSISIIVPDVQSTASSSTRRSASISIELPTSSGELIASSFLTAAESASHTINIVMSSSDTFASASSTVVSTTNDGSSTESTPSGFDQPTLPIGPSVSSLASTNVVDPLPTMVQSAEPSVITSQFSTPLNSIDASITSGDSPLTSYIPDPSSLPAAVHDSAASGGTIESSTYTGSTLTLDVLSSTYAYNVNPASTIATQVIGQLSSHVSSSGNTQPDQVSAQQTSIDSSMDSTALAMTTSSSYVQETTNQPGTDENATSSPLISSFEASSAIVTSREATLTQSYSQAASTSDPTLAPTTSSSETQSTSSSPDMSSNPEPTEAQATSTTVVDGSSNGGPNTTGEDSLIASTTSSALQQTISATLEISSSELLPSDSILPPATEIEATVASSEPTSLVPQSTLTGDESISDIATYSIVSPSAVVLDPSSIDSVPVYASTALNGVINSGPIYVTSTNFVAPTGSILANSDDIEAVTTAASTPIVSLSNQLSVSEVSASQEIIPSSVPVVDSALSLLSSETSSIILPSETSLDTVQTGSTNGSAESYVDPDNLSTTETDVILPSTTEISSYDSLPTPDVGSVISDIVASNTFEFSDLPTQVLSTEAAASSSYAMDAGALPTTATDILPFDPETVASDTGVALPAVETQATLTTTPLGALGSLLSSIVSDAQTVGIAQPSQTAVGLSIVLGEEQASASLSAELSAVPTESILSTDFVSSSISGLVLPSPEIQETGAIASDASLEITTTLPDLYTDNSETFRLIPTSISVNQQVPDITTTADELTTALPGSSVDTLLATLTSLESQVLPTSTYIEDGSAVRSIAEDLTTALPGPSLDSLLAASTSLQSQDLPTSTFVDDLSGIVSSIVATEVPDLPAAASSTVGDVTDLLAAASSDVSEALPTGFVSSIINGVTTDLPLATDLPAAASSVIDGSMPTFASDTKVAATSIVDNTGDLVSSIVSSIEPIVTDPVSIDSDAGLGATSVIDSVGGTASSIVSSIDPVVTDFVPSVLSNAGAVVTSDIDDYGYVTSSIVSFDPAISDAVPSIIFTDGGPSITASVDEIPVTSAGIEPTHITESLTQVTSISGMINPSTIVPTTLSDDKLPSSIATTDVAEPEATLVPTPTDLSVPSLISGALDSSSDLSQQTTEIGSIPSYSADPFDSATSEILSSIISYLSMATTDLVPSATSDVSVIPSLEAIPSTDLSSAVESAAGVTNPEISATAPVNSEPTYSQIDPISTGLDAAATSTTLDPDISTDFSGIEPTISTPLPSTIDVVSLGDGTVSSNLMLSASTTGLEAPDAASPSITAELSSSIESDVAEPVQSDLATSDVLSSASSMLETLLTPVVDSVPSSTDMGSETSIIESVATPTPSAIISEALESLTTIASGDNPISSLVDEPAPTLNAGISLSTPVIPVVPDESTSIDVASMTSISLDVTPASTILEVPSSELAPLSSVLDGVTTSAASIDLSLTAVQSFTSLASQTTDISPTDLISADLPTDPTQAEESIPSSTSIYIDSSSETLDTTLLTVIPESSEPILTAVGAASTTISEATATLAGDDSFYTDLPTSAPLAPTEITALMTSTSVDLGVISDLDAATSTPDILSFSITDGIESVPTSAAGLDQLTVTSLSEILSGLPTEVETMTLSATAALTENSIAPTDAGLSTPTTLSDIESSLTEAIDSLTSTLDASVTVPTESSDMSVPTFASVSETLISTSVEESDDQSQSVEPTSIGSLETDVAAPSIVISSGIVSTPITTEPPSLSTSAIDDLLSSDTYMAFVTSMLDSASSSLSSLDSSDPESVIPSDLAEVQSTATRLVLTDAPFSSAIPTDRMSSIVSSDTSQLEAVSSALDYNGIITSSDALSLAASSTIVELSSLKTSAPDVLGGPTTLLPLESQSLPTSTLDSSVSDSAIPTQNVTFMDPTDIVSSLLSSSIVDDDTSAATSILAQPTDILDVPISTDGQSEASTTFAGDVEATSDSFTILPLATDVPTITSPDPLASITTAPESPETSGLETASIVADTLSTVAPIVGSSSVDLGSIPTSEIVDAAASSSTISIVQELSSATGYADIWTSDLEPIPTSHVADPIESSYTTSVIQGISSAIMSTDSSTVDLGPLPTSDVVDATELPSIAASSDALSDIPASPSTDIEAALETTSTPSVMSDLPPSTTSDALNLITPAPDLPETSYLDTMSSLVENSSSVLLSLADSSAIDSVSQLASVTTVSPDLSSSVTSFDALSDISASLAASTEIQDSIATFSSTIDLPSITSSGPLSLATDTSEFNESSSLDTASAILNTTSLAQSVVGSSTINPGAQLTSAFAEITDLPTDGSSADSESYALTSNLVQATDTPSITSDADIQSKTPSSLDINSEPITDGSMVLSSTNVLSSATSQVTPLTSDLPSNPISGLSALATAAPEPLETGTESIDTTHSTQDVSSIISIIPSSAVVISDSIPASAVSEATDVPSITFNSESETSILPITPSEGITDISTFSSATDVPSSMVSALAADSASSLIDTISASIVLGAASTSSSSIDSDMAVPTSTLVQATGLSDTSPSSVAPSDVFASSDPITETTLGSEATTLPSSPTSSLNSDLLSSVTTSLASSETTATSVEIGSASTDISSLSQDGASTVVSFPSETAYSVSTATDLPLSSSVELDISASTSITAAVSDNVSLSSSIALPTSSADLEPLSSVTAVQSTDVFVSTELGYASPSDLPSTSQLTSSEEAASTIISGLPTEIQTMGPSETATITDSSISSIGAISNTLSQSLDPDPSQISSSLISVADDTSSTSAILQISGDPGLSTSTSPPDLSSIIGAVETSASMGGIPSSAVTLTSVDPPTETLVAAASTTLLSSTSELESAVASSAVLTSQTLLDTTLASVDSTLAASTIQPSIISSVIDSPATSLPTSFAASPESVAITNPNLSSDTVLPAQASLGGASSNALGFSSTVNQISDVVPQTTLSASLVAPTSNVVQIPSTTSSQSGDLTSSILQKESSVTQAASSITLSSSLVSTNDPASGAASSTIAIDPAQTAISTSLPSVSVDQTVPSSVVSMFGSMSATSVTSPSFSVSNPVYVSQVSSSAPVAASTISPDLGVLSSVSSESGVSIVSTSISDQSSSSVASAVTSPPSIAISSLLISSVQSTKGDLISTTSILQSVSSYSTLSSAVNIDVGSTSISVLPETTPTPSSSASPQSSSTTTSAILSISPLPADSSSTADISSGMSIASLSATSLSAAASQLVPSVSSVPSSSISLSSSSPSSDILSTSSMLQLSSVSQSSSISSILPSSTVALLSSIVPSSSVLPASSLPPIATNLPSSSLPSTSINFPSSSISSGLPSTSIVSSVVSALSTAAIPFSSGGSSVATSISSTILSVSSLSISSASFAASTSASSSSTSISVLQSNTQVIEVSASALSLGMGSSSSSINIGASVSSSATSSTATTASLVPQSSLSSAFSIVVPTSSTSTFQVISSQANGASSSTSSTVILSSSSSTISAVSSSAATGYLVNVGVGDTSVGVVQTAGGNNLANVGAGSVASTQISASAASPVTTAVGSAVGSSGLGTTVALSTPTTVSIGVGLSSQVTSSSSTASIVSSASSSSAASMATTSSLSIAGVTNVLASSQMASTTPSSLTSTSMQSSSSSSQAVSSPSLSTSSTTVASSSSSVSSPAVAIPDTATGVLAANPLTTAISISQTTSISSGAGSSTTSLAQVSTSLSSQTSSSSSVAVVASSTSSSQPVVVLTTATSTVVVSVATNILPVSQGTSISSSVGSSTASSALSSSLSSNSVSTSVSTPLIVTPSTMASSSSSIASSSSSIVSSILTASNIVPSNTLIVVSSLSSTPVSSATPPSSSVVVVSVVTVTSIVPQSSSVLANIGSSTKASTSPASSSPVASVSSSSMVSSSAVIVASSPVLSPTVLSTPSTSKLSSTTSGTPSSSIVSYTTSKATITSAATTSSVISYSTITSCSSSANNAAVGIGAVNLLGGNGCSAYILAITKRDEITTLQTMYGSVAAA